MERNVRQESSFQSIPNPLIKSVSDYVSSPIGVGILGLGTVGQGVVRILADSAEMLERRIGRPVKVVATAVRDLDKKRDYLPAGVVLTTDPMEVLTHPDVDVVFEAMGGIEPAKSLILKALRLGKHVVTANKALLADHGTEIFEAAREAERAVCFEAAVAGGIPIIQALNVGLAANRILSISAILNGTCNFIMTAMTRDGKAYGDVLKEAQRLGFAEADPTMDVDGTDTAHKLAVLVQIAFHQTVGTDQISRRGIDRLEAADIRFAGELGYVIKLLAKARWRAEGLELRVSPTLVPKGSQLAEISDSYNAVRVEGDAVGDTLFAGRGAGMMPTASAMVSDLIGISIEPRARIMAAAELWKASGGTIPLIGVDEHKTRAYLRFQIPDRPGQLAYLAQILGDNGISIASVIQHEPEAQPGTEDTFVSLIIMTHMATSGAMRRALEQICKTCGLRGEPIILEVDGRTGQPN